MSMQLSAWEIKMSKKNTMSWMMALLPIISIYSIFGMNLGNIFLIGLSLYGLYRTLTTSGKIALYGADKILAFFLFYTVIISLANLALAGTLELGDVITKYVHIFCFMMIVVFFRTKILKKELSPKPFITVALIASVFLIVQFLAYNLSGLKLYGVLEAYRTDITNDISRPSSFFVEPAHFSRFCTMPLFFVLYKDDSEKKMLKASIISIAMIMSQSSIGYILMAIAWATWVVSVLKNRHINVRSVVEYFVIFVIAIGIAISVGSRYGLFDFVFEHMSGLNMREVSSGNVRVFRGFWVWAKGNVIARIFGVGFANIRNYLIQNNIVTIFDGEMPIGCDYMSAISYILVMNGIIGLAVYFSALASIFKRSESQEKILVILFVLLMLSNEEFMTLDFMNIWLFLLLAIDYRKRMKNFATII